MRNPPMPSQESVDTERSVVTTYVPAYQKAEWETHAEDMDMSLSEFVRSMVQAGRRGFDEAVDNEGPDEESDRQASDVDNSPSEHSTPGVDTQKMVLQALQKNQPLDWDDLVRESIGDLESDIEESIESLQRENQIMHSGREGGYVLVEE